MTTKFFEELLIKDTRSLGTGTFGMVAMALGAVEETPEADQKFRERLFTLIEIIDNSADGTKAEIAQQIKNTYGLNMDLSDIVGSLTRGAGAIRRNYKNQKGFEAFLTKMIPSSETQGGILPWLKPSVDES